MKKIITLTLLLSTLALAKDYKVGDEISSDNYTRACKTINKLNQYLKDKDLDKHFTSTYECAILGSGWFIISIEGNYIKVKRRNHQEEYYTAKELLH